MNNFDNDSLSVNDFKDENKRDKWLRQSSNQFSVVLNDSGADVFKSASHIVNKFKLAVDFAPSFIAVCKHDKDYLEDEQRLETPHYQCVIVFNDFMQFKSLLKLFHQLFPGVNDNQIGIQKVVDLGKMARYVVHRGFLKHQYSLEELECNNFDLYMKYYNMVQIEDQIDCVTIVKQYHYNLEEIITHVSNYSKWRPLIKDLIINQRR